MAIFFRKSIIIATLVPALVLLMATWFFFGELPGVRVLVVCVSTSFLLAINHELSKRIGRLKTIVVGVLLILLNVFILVG